jgi:hypothetical protein
VEEAVEEPLPYHHQGAVEAAAYHREEAVLQPQPLSAALALPAEEAVVPAADLPEAPEVRSWQPLLLFSRRRQLQKPKLASTEALCLEEVPSLNLSSY